MKKLLILTCIALFLNGCRYVNTEEKYVDAKVSPELAIPEGVDTPNTTSTLSVPKAKAETTAIEMDSTPPDMPIRTKQSEDGSKRIENKNGFPLLTVASDKDNAWDLMKSLNVENWSKSSEDKEDCSVVLTYADEDALDRANAGFFKKVFTRDKYYSDYSGGYKLACEVKGSVVEITFSKQDGTAAKTFLADNIMNKLYEKFK